MYRSAFKRGLTIAGVAIGAALLIAAVAVAMRGLAPTASNASAAPGHAVRAPHRPANRVIRRLASWHAPRVPKARRHRASAPVVVTVVAPPTVLPAQPSSAPATTAAPPSTESQSSSSDDQHDDQSEPEPGDE
jgi:hypothetical protein